MSYQVFARKYRPRTFAELLGQDHVRKTLENAIAQERLAHAYLFVGPRGTGKTSTARIFAKALNCPDGPRIDFDPDDPICVEIAEGRSLDVLEIDGATNNGVEQVRQLRETVAYAPASGRFKIYYIDEVHMLSNAAFNALLKTLEEPPPHVKFIFATTEAHKVLPTIVSRCQRFDLRRIPQGIIADHLLHIAEEESIKLDDLAAHSIARGAEGGMRDAQSMLDQLVAFCGDHITEADVLEVFGFTAHQTIADLSGALLDEDTSTCLSIVGAQADAGKDLQRLLADLIAWIRTLLVHGIDPESTTTGDLAPEVVATLAEQEGRLDNDHLLAAMDVLAEAEARMRWAPDKKMHFEVAMVKACRAVGSTSISDVIRMLGDDSTPPSSGDRNGGNDGGGQGGGRDDNNRSPAAPSTAAGSARGEVATSGKSGSRSARASLAETMAEVAAEQAGKTPATAQPAAVEESDASSGPEPSSGTAVAVPDPELWPSALQRIQEERPLVAAWAEDAHDLGLQADTLTLGFPIEAEGSLQSLERPTTREQILEILALTAGRKIGLELVLDDKLELKTHESQETAAFQATSETSPAGQTAPDTTDDDAGGSTATHDFYDDPLVKDAMQVFAAELAEREQA